MTDLTAYSGLFIAALLAASLIPAQSESVLVGLVLSQHYVFWGLIAIATLGNTLGSVINWWLGRYLQHFQHKRWFPVSAAGLQRAQMHFQRYGLWSLLLSWVPIIGDPLTVVAGLLRVPFWVFLGLVTLAKGGRYLLLAWLAS